LAAEAQAALLLLWKNEFVLYRVWGAEGMPAAPVDEVLARKPQRRVDWLVAQLRKEAAAPTGLRRDLIFAVLSRRDGRAVVQDLSVQLMAKLHEAIHEHIELFTFRQQRVLTSDSFLELYSEAMWQARLECQEAAEMLRLEQEAEERRRAEEEEEEAKRREESQEAVRRRRLEREAEESRRAEEEEAKWREEEQLWRKEQEEKERIGAADDERRAAPEGADESRAVAGEEAAKDKAEEETAAGRAEEEKRQEEEEEEKEWREEKEKEEEEEEEEKEAEAKESDEDVNQRAREKKDDVDLDEELDRLEKARALDRFDRARSRRREEEDVVRKRKAEQNVKSRGLRDEAEDGRGHAVQEEDREETPIQHEAKRIRVRLDTLEPALERKKLLCIKIKSEAERKKRAAKTAAKDAKIGSEEMEVQKRKRAADFAMALKNFREAKSDYEATKERIEGLRLNLEVLEACQQRPEAI